MNDFDVPSSWNDTNGQFWLFQLLENEKSMISAFPATGKLKIDDFNDSSVWKALNRRV